MSEQIQINKTTLMLLGLLLVAVVAGAVFLAPKGSILSTATNPTQTTNPTTPNTGGVQEVYLKALSNGNYDNMQITVRKGIPVRMYFSAEPNTGCGRQLVIRGLGVQAVSNGQQQMVEFTPQNEGTYQYTCGMGMWGPGRLVVTA
jgi:plastocyanin domain-containing protein